MNRILIVFVLCLSVFILTSYASQVVYSQPAVFIADGATMSDFDPSIAWGNHYQFAADDFSLSETTLISEVRWWGIYQKDQPVQNIQPPDSNSLPASNFTIRFFTDEGGLPGNVEFEFNSIGNCNRIQLQAGETGTLYYFEYRYKFSESVSLNGEQLYWISIVDSTGSFPEDIFFSWLKSDSSNWCYSFVPGGLTGWTWYDGSPGMAFELISGSIPCPSADLTGDCFVNLQDFLIIASEWLTGETNI